MTYYASWPYPGLRKERRRRKIREKQLTIFLRLIIRQIF